jgi:hypothetical protein
VSALIDNRKDESNKVQEVVHIYSLLEPKGDASVSSSFESLHVILILRLLTLLPTPVSNLITPTRRLVWQCVLGRRGRRSRGSSQCYLFNDVLLLCEAIVPAGAGEPSAQGSKFRATELLSIADVVVSVAPSAPHSDSAVHTQSAAGR